MSQWRKPFAFHLAHKSSDTSINNNNNNSTHESSESPFREQLAQICEFLTENKSKTNYILDLYYQRHVSRF